MTSDIKHRSGFLFLDMEPTELITQLKENLPTSIITNFILAVMTVWILYETVPYEILICWFVVHIILAALRVYTAHRLVSKELMPNHWFKRKIAYFVIMLLVGISWGITSILAAIYSPIIIQVIIALIITGLTAGAIATLTPIFIGFIAYFLGSLSLQFLIFAISSSEILVILSPIVLLYIAVVFVSGKKLYESIFGALKLANELQQLNQIVIDQKNQAEQSSIAKSTFLSSMSHELRTPLNAILGFTQLLQMDEIDSDKMDNLNIINESSQHLLNLINEILELSQLESDNSNIHLQSVSLSNCVIYCVNMIKPLAKKHHINVNFSTLLNDDIWVDADKQRLQQVILNLLNNAVKYNKAEGSINITCQAVDDGYAKLAIQDNGLGIPDEKQNLVFSVFHRLGMEAGSIEGSGIGLFFSKRLMELMGGEIGFESTEGVGSIFWIKLRMTNTLNPSADDDTNQK